MITLLHTSPVHVATFDALRDQLAPGIELSHTVRTDWLSRAQSGLDQSLIDDISETIAATQGATVCSCTTIGEIAGAAGAIRIDAPMMARAARIGGRILMAYALASTRAPSLALLQQTVNDLGADGANVEIILLDLSHFWPLFEAGETTAFAACIAGGIRDAAGRDHPDCVVLAQASMADAAPLLADLATPVFSSPELALRAALSTVQET